MQQVCSNRAATQTNNLKTQEKHYTVNSIICRYFANSRNLLQTIVLPSHGRGRWFEPSIAHLEKAVFYRQNVSSKEASDQIRGFFTATVLQPASAASPPRPERHPSAY